MFSFQWNYGYGIIENVAEVFFAKRTSIVTGFLAKHETEVIAQPPYSPDLAPCDFFLFPKLKYPLRGTRHETIEAIKRNSLKELKAISHYQP